MIRRFPSKNFVEIWNTNLLVLIMGWFANAAKARILAALAGSLLASMLAPVLVRGVSGTAKALCSTAPWMCSGFFSTCNVKVCLWTKKNQTKFA